MVRLPEIDCIGFLVKRKFPASEQLERSRFPPIPTVSEAISPGYRPVTEKLTPLGEETLKNIQEYREELAALPPDELSRMYSEAVQDKQREDDAARFFSLSSADADFEYWAKMAHWTLDEAIALSFGKAPERVNRKSLERTPHFASPFVREYERVRKLAERAVVWKELFDPVLPSLFIKWAQDVDLPIPDELVEKVEARRGRFIDWKGRYDQLLERNNNNVELANRAIAARDKQIADLETAQDKDQLLPAKERESLLRLVVGMAVGGYGYNPREQRSRTTKEISDDLDRLGISLSSDTIRKWLREAAGRLSEEALHSDD